MLDRLRRHDDEDGFTLIEVVVALTLLGVLLATVSVALGAMLNKVRNNQNRTVAANIATRTIDRLHAIPASQLPSGSIPDQVFQAEGSTYTVSASAVLVADAASTTASACDGGGALSAKKVSVSVTWSGMGSTRPVRSDTLRQLTASEFDLTKGGLSVKVVDRAGTPVAGQQVTLMPGSSSATTQADGCAVFSNVPAGTKSVALVPPSTNWVDPQGVNNPSRTVNVVGGAVTKDAGFTYDRAGSITATYNLTDLNTYPVRGLGMTLANAAYIGGSKTFPTTAAGATLTKLFPFADGYRAWAGTCNDARPTALPSAVLVQPDAVQAVSLPLATVRVEVEDKRGKKEFGQTVRIQHTSDSGCPLGVDTTITAPAGSSRVGFSLPAGTWSVSSGGGVAVALTSLQPGGAPRDVVVRQP